MPEPIPELVVRQYQRHRCDLPAHISIEPEHAPLVRPAGAALDPAGLVRARVIDASLGGLGLRTGVFLPRTCRLRVRIPDPAGGPPLLDALLIVQRTALTDRAPTYYLGASFAPGSPAPRLAPLLAAGPREDAVA